MEIQEELLSLERRTLFQIVDVPHRTRKGAGCTLHVSWRGDIPRKASLCMRIRTQYHTRATLNGVGSRKVSLSDE